jgi:ribosome recycling factor
MHKEIIAKTKPELDKTMVYLEKELSKIHGSRPSIALIEEVQIDYYGTKTPLKQLAALSLTDSRTITIQPWDRSSLLSIERAFLSSQLGVNPVVDKDIIRLPFPPINEEYRKELLKVMNGKMEEARLTVRRHREDAWRRIQEGFRQGQVREDDKFRAKDELQKVIDEYNEKIENIGKKKEDEIMN